MKNHHDHLVDSMLYWVESVKWRKWWDSLKWYQRLWLKLKWKIERILRISTAP